MPSGDGEVSSSAESSDVDDGYGGIRSLTPVVAEPGLEPNGKLAEIPVAESDFHAPPAHDTSHEASATSSLAEQSKMCPASKEQRRKELTAKIDLLRRGFLGPNVCQHDYVNR